MRIEIVEISNYGTYGEDIQDELTNEGFEWSERNGIIKILLKSDHDGEGYRTSYLEESDMESYNQTIVSILSRNSCFGTYPKLEYKD